jgi:hypothetical protein
VVLVRDAASLWMLTPLDEVPAKPHLVARQRRRRHGYNAWE